MHLAILICTHNRDFLLSRLLDSLCANKRPAHTPVHVLVMANGCTDTTVTSVESRIKSGSVPDWITLQLVEEPRLGKSWALNTGIALLDSDLVAFIDDDHRLPEDYLVTVQKCSEQHPEIDLLCGQIRADWDGNEPDWAHDTSEYQIFPMPVPIFDLGQTPLDITLENNRRKPGGGNIVMRQRVTQTLGTFPTHLGPQGHDLGGAEDLRWLVLGMEKGVSVRYLPDIIQYHYVDLERFKLRYLMEKAYKRTATAMSMTPWPETAWLPAYMLPKILINIGQVIRHLGSDQKRRYHLVRLAATFGQVKGFIRSWPERRNQ
ncbi:MAG: glycosyltransferase family 2 protein [Magnetococcales bacterium]|nr:glycosyltransferase family 2 protein [Magnetococcales bacterium]